tara:strand:- start:445 stop:1038 length:594 start_codon:yes stop_codon:yes gene_type:complete
MYTIYLHGALADHIPDGKFTAAFNNVREAVSCIDANFPGFHDIIRSMKLHVLVGDIDKERDLDERQALLHTINNDIHIMPAMDGDGGDNKALKVILGIGLIAVGFIGVPGIALGSAVFGNVIGITGLQLVGMGAGIVLSALTQPPEMQPEPDAEKSAMYQGPINTQAEGSIVPYVAGHDVIVGGMVIHADLQIVQEI